MAWVAWVYERRTVDVKRLYLSMMFAVVYAAFGAGSSQTFAHPALPEMGYRGSDGPAHSYVSDPVTGADSYKCYEVEDSTRIRTGYVGLDDGFGEGPDAGVRVGEPKILCNPVVKYQQADLVEPKPQLTCYKIKSGEPERTVEIANEFGAQTLVIDNARHLCVPGVTLSVAQGDRLKDDDDDRKRHRKRHRRRKHGHDDGPVTPPISTKIILSSSETILGQKIVYPTGSQALITSAIITFQPGAVTGLHRHDVPLFGYLMQGELTVTYETGEVKTFHPGDSLLEALGTPHSGENTSKGITKIFVVFAGAEGVPNTVSLE